MPSQYYRPPHHPLLDRRRPNQQNVAPTAVMYRPASQAPHFDFASLSKDDERRVVGSVLPSSSSSASSPSLKSPRPPSTLHQQQPTFAYHQRPLQFQQQPQGIAEKDKACLFPSPTLVEFIDLTPLTLRLHKMNGAALAAAPASKPSLIVKLNANPKIQRIVKLKFHKESSLSLLASLKDVDDANVLLDLFRSGAQEKRDVNGGLQNAQIQNVPTHAAGRSVQQGRIVQPTPLPRDGRAQQAPSPSLGTHPAGRSVPQGRIVPPSPLPPGQRVQQTLSGTYPRFGDVQGSASSAFFPPFAPGTGFVDGRVVNLREPHGLPTPITPTFQFNATRPAVAPETSARPSNANNGTLVSQVARNAVNQAVNRITSTPRPQNTPAGANLMNHLVAAQDNQKLQNLYASLRRSPAVQSAAPINKARTISKESSASSHVSGATADSILSHITVLDPASGLAQDSKRQQATQFGTTGPPGPTHVVPTLFARPDMHARKRVQHKENAPVLSRPPSPKRARPNNVGIPPPSRRAVDSDSDDDIPLSVRQRLAQVQAKANAALNARPTSSSSSDVPIRVQKEREIEKKTANARGVERLRGGGDDDDDDLPMSASARRTLLPPPPTPTYHNIRDATGRFENTRTFAIPKKGIAVKIHKTKQLQGLPTKSKPLPRPVQEPLSEELDTAMTDASEQQMLPSLRSGGQLRDSSPVAPKRRRLVNGLRSSREESITSTSSTGRSCASIVDEHLSSETAEVPRSDFRTRRERQRIVGSMHSSPVKKNVDNGSVRRIEREELVEVDAEELEYPVEAVSHHHDFHPVMPLRAPFTDTCNSISAREYITNSRTSKTFKSTRTKRGRAKRSAEPGHRR